MPIDISGAQERSNTDTSSKLGLLSLTAFVVGSMIGGGVFSLPQNMARGASAGAVTIGLLITGVGMLALAFVYRNLSTRKPALDAGPYSYARAGFGDYIGFNSAWGYWLSAWIGNVSYAVLIFGALGYFYPPFGAEGNTWQAIVGASISLWLVHALVLMGVRQAAIVSVIRTIAKLAPIFLFIALESIVSPWGSVVVHIGLVISVAGAFLRWILLAAEIPFQAAKDGMLPSVFASENANGSPSGALWITNICIQIALVVALNAISTYLALFYIASTAIIVICLFSSTYALKLTLGGENYAAHEGRGADMAIGALATVSGAWLVYAAWPAYLLMCAILYAMGILIYIWARQSHKERAFKPIAMLITGGPLVAAT